MFEGILHFNKNDDERARLRIQPIVDPTIGHLAMLPLGAEGVLLKFNTTPGQRAMEGFVVTQGFIDKQAELVMRHGKDTPLGVSVLLYVLPEGEGPLREQAPDGG